MNSNPNSGASLERKLLKGVERLMRGVGPSLMRSPILVAVSGGPDSLALLLLLARLREALGLTLHVAHLNHGLRGADAEDDAQFVKETANSLGLPATMGAEDVKSYAAGRGLSPEEAAREARYAFLTTVAAEHGAAAAALGHTADDQAETVLMHVLRGSGLTGLAGMSALSYRPAAQGGERVALLRPLLDATREETAAYCRWRGFAPRDDATNRSLEFTRNKIRLELLPFLNSYNPRIREGLLRLSAAAAHDQDYIIGEAAQAFGKAGGGRRRWRPHRARGVRRAAPGPETPPAKARLPGGHRLDRRAGTQPHRGYGQTFRDRSGQERRPAGRPDILHRLRLPEPRRERGRRVRPARPERRAPPKSPGADRHTRLARHGAASALWR